MAIDLPPVIASELASSQEMHSFVQDEQSKPITAKVAGYDVLVYGNTALSTEQVVDVLEKANSLQDGVSQLQLSYIQSGHLLTRLRYLLKNNQLLIRVINGKIGNVEGPESMTRLFWDVEGQTFEISKFETSRILADLQAAREGLLTRASYKPSYPESEQIELFITTQKDPEFRALKLNAELGNPGNRFVGRHFLFSNAILDTRVAQWRLSLTHSIDSLDDNDREGSLEGYQLAGSSVIPIGLVGYGISQTEYEFTDSVGKAFDSETTQAQLLFQEILQADSQSRSLLSQRLIFVDTNRKSSTSEQVLDERYFAAEVGFEFFRRLKLWDTRPVVNFSTNVRKGLSNNSGTLGPQENGTDRDARFLLFRPDLSLKFTTTGNWVIELNGSSQFSDRQVPEQQQWYLGGSNRLRAWLPGTLLGDGGHYLGIQANSPEYTVWNKLKIRPGVFLETGRAKFKSNETSIAGTQQATDAGVALEFSLGSHWELSLAAAEPVSESGISDEFIRDNEAEFYFSLKANW